jgi:PKD repeat protein
MHRRWLALVLAIVIVLSLSGRVPATAGQLTPRALVKITLGQQRDLRVLESMAIPVYAHLTTNGQAYLLAGAAPREIEALEAQGLDVTLLDASVHGATYYRVYLPPGHAPLDWQAFGRVLLDEGTQVLLRTTPRAAERLALAGAELQAITLAPKPLQRQPSDRAIPAVLASDSAIQTILNQVDSSTVSQYDRELAGELPVLVDGDWYTITSRYTYSGTPIQKAGHYVGQRMADLGLDVEYQDWDSSTNPNVIGELSGLTRPDDVFIIGAHLDDVLDTPGADDNASGSVATMIAADILSRYDWDCTLRFAFWTGEEQGLLGSAAYAQRAWSLDENIVGYLNLDMIAYNTTGSSPGIDLIYNPTVPSTQQLAQLFADVVDTYDLNLVPDLRFGLSGGSDHSSFWQYGYNSILAIEDQEDFNPFYHQPSDTPAHTDLGYFTEFVKGSLGTFAHMSDCLLPGSLGSLDGHVVTAGGVTPIAGAAVTMANSQGQAWQATTDDSGYYTATLPADTYTVTVSAYGYSPALTTGVVVPASAVTTQDFALEPLPCTLLVDDDEGAGYEQYYEEALTARGEEYALWTVADAGSPASHDLAQYGRVIWFTGDDDSNTLTAGDRSALAAYLDGGGRLFVSGQNIGSDIGADPFYADYLHATYQSDNTDSDSLTGLDFLSGIDPVIRGGDGADNQDSPSDVTPTADAFAVLDYADPHLYGGVAYEDYTYRLVYFSFGFEAIDDEVDRTEVMSRTLAWLGGCACEAVNGVDFSWAPPTPKAGQVVDFAGVAEGTAPIAFTWDLGDGTQGRGATLSHAYAHQGDYPVVLTATNACGTDAISHTVTVLPAPCQPAQIVTVTTEIAACSVTFGADVDGSPPFTFAWDFGELGSSDQPAPVLAPISGTHPYTLTLLNCGGVYSDTVSGVVTVACEPACEPAQILTVGAQTSACRATLEPELGGTPPFTYDWDLSALGSSTAPTVTLEVDVGGTYPYTLTVVNCDGAYSDVQTGTVTLACRAFPGKRCYLPLVVRQE